MTRAEHIARHLELHRALDELLADFIRHQPLDNFKSLSETTLLEFLRWSCLQTIEPTALPDSYEPEAAEPETLE